MLASGQVPCYSLFQYYDRLSELIQWEKTEGIFWLMVSAHYCLVLCLVPIEAQYIIVAVPGKGNMFTSYLGLEIYRGGLGSQYDF